MKKKAVRTFAFFNPRALIGFGLCSLGLLLALLTYTSYPGASLLAQNPSQQMTQPPAFQVVASYHNDVSRPLRDLASWTFPSSGGEHEANLNPMIPIRHIDRPDPVVQNKFLSRLAPHIPGPILNFNGIPFPGTGIGCNQCRLAEPPDTDGYPGLTQYVQIVNKYYQVFDKFTGASVLGPAPIQSIWAGFGGNCEFFGGGDPIVLYDKLADRWLISQASFPGDECIAISQSRDATGSYNRYGFHLGSNFYDYPKLAAWPDAYYMSNNVFSPGGSTYLGPQPFAFDRTKMLCGLPATAITPGVVGNPANNENSMLPSDLDGSVLPPPSAPNSFVEFPNSGGNNGGTYRTWHFHVDFATPANSTFTEYADPAAAPYTSLCFATCVPQLPPETDLDGIGDRLMFRVAYRNFGTPSAPHESTVGNFSVSSGGVAGVRWFELRNVTNGPETLNQESTYQPDTTWRWMGSVAMDHSGDLAVGFSASSPTINPQIRYAGRFLTDPPGTLAQGEAHLFDGTGSQSDSFSRWGDYSALTVDPVDDTTMWYTQEYYATNSSSFNWRTRIGTFLVNANQPLVNVSAKSELTHGSAGPFAIDLPLYAVATRSGRGVECRNGSGGGYTIIFNFTNSITTIGGVTSTCGTGTAAIGTDNHRVLVSLSAGSCNAQYITVQLNNVSDGTNTISPAVTFGLLIGDLDGNGTVNASDVSQAKAQVGMLACPPNFRADVNGDGIINSSDIAFVKSKSGTSLPTPP